MGAANAVHYTFFTTGPIASKRIAKFTANPREVSPAAAATDKLAGVVDFAATAAGQPVDIAVGGVDEVQAGGNIAAGDPLTSDANGKAVVATYTAGVTKHVIGKALAPAVDGEIVPYVVAPSVIAG